MCEHELLQTDYHTRVCLLCGCERSYIGTIKTENTSYRQSYVPWVTSYSRKKRFKSMAECVLNPSPCYLDEPIFKILGFTARFDTVNSLLSKLKSLKLKDKRYQNLHLFCKLFVSSYKNTTHKFDFFHTIKQLTFRFEEIEFSFKRLFPAEQFFNYSWLLNAILFDHGLRDFCAYIKPLKCKKRCKKYTTMYHHIRSELIPLHMRVGFRDVPSNFQ